MDSSEGGTGEWDPSTHPDWPQITADPEAWLIGAVARQESDHDLVGAAVTLMVARQLVADGMAAEDAIDEANEFAIGGILDISFDGTELNIERREVDDG